MFWCDQWETGKSFAHSQTKGSILEFIADLEAHSEISSLSLSGSVCYLANAISHLSVCQLVQVHYGIGQDRSEMGKDYLQSRSELN